VCNVNRSKIHNWTQKIFPGKQKATGEKYDISFGRIYVTDPADMFIAYLPEFGCFYAWISFKEALKNVSEAVNSRQKSAKKRRLYVINEHSESTFNTERQRTDSFAEVP